MTDTAREAAIERVRAYVESWEGFEPSVTISDERDPNSLYLGDLRLLLSGGEGGSVASLPVKAVDEPATISMAALLADRPLGRLLPAVEKYAWQEIDRLFEKARLPKPPVRLRDELVTHLLWARHGERLQAALTDPRQPSEAGDVR